MSHPTYVMHDDKRWRVAETYEEDGEQWYRLVTSAPGGKHQRTVYARVRECSPWLRPHRRTIEGETSLAVRLKCKGRRRVDTTLGAILSALAVANGLRTLRDRQFRRRTQRRI